MRKTVVAILCLSVLAWSMAGAAEGPAKRHTNIPAQELAPALRSLAKALNFQIVFASQEVSALRTQGVVGEFTPEEALRQILSGTGLTFRYVDEKTITIVPVNGTPKASGIAADPAASLLARAEGSAGKKDEKTQGGVEEMLVEGEREKPAPFSTANLDLTRTEDDVLPFQVFTAREIELSGATNVEDFLRKRLPQFVSDTLPEEINTTSNAPNTDGLNSNNQINLRGWGANSGDAARETVILVNGRPLPPRFVNDGSDAQMIQGDFRGIPLGLIERIEILTSAGSAIYGGGATSGVVNIILRKDVRGGQVAVSYNDTWHGRSPRRSADFSYGMPLKWGIGLQMSAGLSDSRSLYVADRLNVTRLDQERLLNARTLYDDWGGGTREEIIGYGYNPDYLMSPPMVGATTNIRSRSDPYETDAANLFGSLGQSNVTSVPAGYTGGQGIQPFLNRIGVYNYELSEGSQDTTYSKRSTMGDPMRSDTLNLGLNKALGRHLNLFVGYTYNKSTNTPTSRYFSPNRSFDGDDLVVPGAAAINPFGRDVLVAFDDPRMAQPSVKKGSISTAQGFSATLNADFGEWKGVLDASYSKNKFVWNRNFFLEPLGGWQNAFLTGAYNPFVDMRVAAPAAPSFYDEFVLTRELGISESASRQAAARISGPVLKLPAGTVQLTGGLGWSVQDRTTGKQDILHVNSRTGQLTGFVYPRPNGPLVLDTDIDSGAIHATDPGRQYVFANYSAYAETTVPVLSSEQNIPLIKRLEIFGSGRIEYAPRKGAQFVGFDANHEQITRPFTYDVRPHTEAFGARYDVIESIALRASRSIGFRPPTMDESIPSGEVLSTSLISNIVTGNGFNPLRDPRRNNEPLSPAGMQLALKGNADILPETAISTNYGVILQPGRLGMRFSMDYVENIRNNAITGLNPQLAIDLEADLPGRIGRGVPDGLGVGRINFIDYRYVNFRQISSKSVDFSLSQAFKEVFGGSLMLSAAASRLLSFKIQASATSSPVEYVGRPNSPLSQSTSWNGNMQLQWQRDRWIFGWSAGYRDRARFFDGVIGAIVVPWVFDHDAVVGYRAPSVDNPRGLQRLFADTSITFGMQNVFDRKPRTWGATAEYPIGNRVSSDSIIGRTISLQVRRSF